MLILFQEVDVSGRDDAHQLSAHLAIICYRDSTEAVASLGLEHISYTFFGAHHHRVCDESLLITLEEEGEGGKNRQEKEQSSRMNEINGKREKWDK